MFGNQFGDTLNTLTQDIISDLKRLKQRCTAINRLKQAIVRDGNECIHLAAKLRNRPIGVLSALFALKAKWLGSNTDDENA